MAKLTIGTETLKETFCPECGYVMSLYAKQGDKKVLRCDGCQHLIAGTQEEIKSEALKYGGRIHKKWLSKNGQKLLREIFVGFLRDANDAKDEGEEFSELQGKIDMLMKLSCPPSCRDDDEYHY